jgi:DNA-binding transcriptional LysR family regulator
MSRIVFDGIEADRTWAFSGPDGTTVRVPIRPRLTVNGVEATIDAAVAGIGITRALTSRCAAGLATDTLVRVLRDLEPALFPVNLTHAGREPLPLKLRTFLDHAGAQIRRTLASGPT